MAERHVWVLMEDGVRLAASLYLPDTREPCAVLLEALPYRKDDVTAGYRKEDERLAGEHGYGVARVDVRDRLLRGRRHRRVPAAGAGRPLPGDRVAGRAAVVDGRGRHVRHQLLRVQLPPGGGRAAAGAKAIVAIYATDDRYTDDLHYLGGALRLLDLVDYPLYMVALNALPPVPAATTGRSTARSRSSAIPGSRSGLPPRRRCVPVGQALRRVP